MPEGQDPEGYQIGGGLIAGLSENVAERLARLAPIGPGRTQRASVADTKPAAKRAGAKTTSSKDKKAMAPRKPSTKSSKAAVKKTAAKAKPKTDGKNKASGSSNPRSSSPPGSGQRPARGQAPGGSASQDSPRSSSEAIAQQETVFTEATPGGDQKTVAQMLGEVTWLMTQSPAHKTFFLSDLEWLAMAPIMMKQFRVFYATDKTAEGKEGQSASRPIGVVLWALVDEEVEKRLEAGNAKLRPQDWRSGDRLWVVEIIAPFGGHDEMLKDLKSQVFKDKTLKFRAIVDGKPAVREV